MEVKVKTPEDLLFSILNTTYEFLGETGGEELLKNWCYYVAEHGVWGGVREAYAEKGIEGIKEFSEALLRAEKMPASYYRVWIEDDKLFIEIKHCHSQETVKKTGKAVYGNACKHCVHISEKMAELVGFHHSIEYDRQRGYCKRTWTRK